MLKHIFSLYFYFLSTLHSGSEVWEESGKKPIWWFEFPFREITPRWHISQHATRQTIGASDLSCLDDNDIKKRTARLTPEKFKIGRT